MEEKESIQFNAKLQNLGRLAKTLFEKGLLTGGDHYDLCIKLWKSRTLADLQEVSDALQEAGKRRDQAHSPRLSRGL